jgi:hypothetical protein
MDYYLKNDSVILIYNHSLNIMIKVKLARRKKTEVPYCPNCFTLLESADNVGGWLSPKTYICPNPECNYRGSFYVTRDEDEEQTSSSDENENAKN